jgi:hypothetical protein
MLLGCCQGQNRAVAPDRKDVPNDLSDEAWAQKAKGSEDRTLCIFFSLSDWPTFWAERYDSRSDPSTAQSGRVGPFFTVEKNRAHKGRGQLTGRKSAPSEKPGGTSQLWRKRVNFVLFAQAYFGDGTWTRGFSSGAEVRDTLRRSISC